MTSPTIEFLAFDRKVHVPAEDIPEGADSPSLYSLVRAWVRNGPATAESSDTSDAGAAAPSLPEPEAALADEEPVQYGPECFTSSRPDVTPQNMALIYKTAWTNTHTQFCEHKRRRIGDRYAARHEAITAVALAERERADSEEAAATAAAAANGGGMRHAQTGAAASQPQQASGGLGATTHAEAARQGAPRTLAAINLQPRAAIPLSPASRAAAQQAAARSAAGAAVSVAASVGGPVNLTSMQPVGGASAAPVAAPEASAVPADGALAAGVALEAAEVAVPPSAVAASDAAPIGIAAPEATAADSQMAEGGPGALVGLAAQAAMVELDAPVGQAAGAQDHELPAGSASGDVAMDEGGAEDTADEAGVQRTRDPRKAA